MLTVGALPGEGGVLVALQYAPSSTCCAMSHSSTLKPSDRWPSQVDAPCNLRPQQLYSYVMVCPDAGVTSVQSGRLTPLLVTLETAGGMETSGRVSEGPINIPPCQEGKFSGDSSSLRCSIDAKILRHRRDSRD